MPNYKDPELTGISVGGSIRQTAQVAARAAVAAAAVEFFFTVTR